MAQRSADFELGTNNAAILTSDAGSPDAWQIVEDPGDGSIIYSNTHAYGALAAKIDGGSGASSTLLSWTGMTVGATHYGRAYVYPTTRPAGKCIAPIEAGVAYRGSISLGPGGTFDINDSAGVSHGTSTFVLPLNQWTRLEWKFVSSATVGQVELKIFAGANVEGATADETLTSLADLNLGVTVNAFEFGCVDSTPGVMWWDNIVAAATSYPGPAVGVALDDCLPDADIVTTGWTTAPLFSKVNDSSDSTVIQATAV